MFRASRNFTTAGTVEVVPFWMVAVLPVADVTKSEFVALASNHVGVHALASYPAKLHNLWQTVFEGKTRDPQGAIGVVGIGRIGGQIADSHQATLKDKIYALISLLASVNLLLFLFNLLPLLPLDGGHVAGAIVEAAKRGRARFAQRRERRTNPGLPRTRPQIFVDTAQMLPVMYGVASVLILVTLLTLYADIVNPISIGG